MAYAIPDWDFLLENPDLQALGKLPPDIQQICIPKSYLPALANLPTQSTRQIHRYSELLRNLTSIFQAINQSEDHTYVCPQFSNIFTSISPADPDHPDLAPENPRHQAILAALYQRKHVADQVRAGAIDQDDVVILTHHEATVALAAYAGIEARLLPRSSPYTGRCRITLDPPQYAAYLDYKQNSIFSADWQKLAPADSPFRPNQYLHIANPLPAEPLVSEDSPSAKDSSASKAPPILTNLRRFDAATESLQPLRYFDRTTYPKYAKIIPKNVGQHMLLDALLAPADEIPIVIVQGDFGTGKTFLSVAAACASIHNKAFSRIIVCPRDSKLGENIGAIPGDTADKTRVKARGILDNLREVLRIYHELPLTPNCNATLQNRVEEFIKANVEFIPLTDIGGSSLSHSFILYDEFQDMTPQQARTLVTRLGDRSKMVIMGDPQQINNPQLSRHNNGLRYLIDRLAGKPGIALITLQPNEIVRHQVLHDIASYL